jgi:hypothetical protein
MSRSVHRFQTLVRLHELQLEQARVERAALDVAVERQRVTVGRLRSELDDSRALAQQMVTRADGVAVNSLRQLQDYARWQAAALAEQERALERSRALAEDARLEVERRFERLSVIERARDRQMQLDATHAARREQQNLDAEVPTRAAAAVTSLTRSTP